MAPILEANNLRKTFLDPRRAALLALDGLSFSAEEGEFLLSSAPQVAGKAPCYACSPDWSIRSPEKYAFEASC